MSVNDALIEIGVKLPDMVAGAAGGLIRAVMLKPSGQPWRASDIPNVVTLMTCGSLIAAYLTEPIAKFTGMSQGPAGFLVGIVGLALCQSAYDQILKRWRVGPTDKT